MSASYDADPQFLAQPEQVTTLLHNVANGSLVIPDFQRNFTWEPKRTALLLESMMSRFPAGTFLFWSIGTENSGFGHRAVQGAPERVGVQPNTLILDGQQRITSLYRALNNEGDERFYLQVDKFVTLPGANDPEGRVLQPNEIAFEDSIFWETKASASEIRLQDRDVMISENTLALDEHEKFDEWIDDFIDYHQGRAGAKATKKVLRSFREAYLRPLQSYGFPVVKLPSTTRIEAVARVFESINSTGKPLGPFELLTARFFPDEVFLRDLWDKALVDYHVLEDFGVDAYSILQSVTLRSHSSAQRADVLRRLTADDVKRYWDPIVRGFARVLEFLQSQCGVYNPKLLPYSMILVPMAAVYEVVEGAKGAEKANINAKLKRFFWCTVFMSNYDQGANSQAGADYAKLREWLFDDDAIAPEAVDNFVFNASTLRSANTRRKALYAGFLALTVHEGARDFHTALSLSGSTSAKTGKLDSHHIFPKAFLKKTKLDEKTGYGTELILNRALIDAQTNKAIGSKSPRDYIADVRSKISNPDELLEIFESHLIDAKGDDSPLMTNDYKSFIDSRLDDAIDLISRVCDSENIIHDNPRHP
ncbi:MAG: DUF262 domain-containing protein [Brevibacterium aurantiacum]|nr:DUF262 domain-containing protein [Brevibacterium aurantiacum]